MSYRTGVLLGALAASACGGTDSAAAGPLPFERPSTPPSTALIVIQLSRQRSHSRPASKPVVRRGGARDRRWARLSSRSVALKPRATLREHELQGDAGRPTHPAAPIRRRHRDAPCARERPSLTAERGPRGDEPRGAVSKPRCRPRHPATTRTGARAPQRGSPQTPKAQTERFGPLLSGSFRT